MRTATLLVSCPDQKGLTTNITGFVTSHNGNIVHADQHIDMETNTFFMRIEWDLADFELPDDAIEEGFHSLADSYGMRYSLYFSENNPRVALFCSKQLHCVADILTRYQAGELACEIPLVVSNHETVAELAAHFDIPFHHIPVTKETKERQEKKQLALLEAHDIHTVVMARYMRILSAAFIDRYPNRIINIHHSFLPAFVGKKPYHQAFSRGVKVIGATAHYATEDLDQGPIIEQDTVRVSHSDSVKDMQLKGQDLEKAVLARALRLHLQHKILAYNNKTVVFD
jgi:formyltetrahydrofolate deformylase